MKTRRYFKQLLLASSIVSLGLYAAPAAQAAFEWTPPKKVEQPAPQAKDTNGDDVDMMPAAPVEEVEASDPLAEMPMQEQAPVEYVGDDEVQEDLKEIIEEAKEKNEITPVAEIPASEKIDEIPENAVVQTAPPEQMVQPDMEEEQAVAAEEVMEEPQPETPVLVAEPEETSEEMPDPNMVQGFGNDLPLIMAVRQIVPTDMPYAFGESLDLSQPVSWQGGASWQDTLKAIADENNLEVAFNDEMVRISNMNTTLAPEMKQPEIETIRLESIQESEEVMPAEAEEVVEVIMESDDVPVTEALEEEPNTAEMMPDVEVTEMIIVSEEPSENEVLEASISDAIVISPIEDMAPIPLVAQNGENDALSEVTEGAVIGRIDEPPSQEVLEAASEEMIAIPVEMEEEPTVIETMEEDLVEETSDMVKEEVTDIVIIEENDEIQAVIETSMSEEIEMKDIVGPSMSEMDDVVEMIEEEQPMVQPMAEAMPLQITEPAPVVVADVPMESDLTETMPVVQVDAPDTAPAQMARSEKLDMVKTWKVKKNSDLKQTLENWSDEVGVNLQWKMDKDYSVNYMVWVDGNFEEAVDVLMQGYENEQGLIPAASMQMDATGPVLIIEPAA